MRNTLVAVLALAALAAIPAANAQSRTSQYRDPPAQSRNEEFYRHRDAAQIDLDQADARLNRVYQRRIADAQAADRADQRRRRNRGWYSQETALRSAERAWIAYRDADCRYAVQQAQGQRDYNSTMRACLIDRTNERLGVLQDARTLMSSR